MFLKGNWVTIDWWIGLWDVKYKNKCVPKDQNFVPNINGAVQNGKQNGYFAAMLHQTGYVVLHHIVRLKAHT